MIAVPSWETIPFHFVWISLTLVYGFRIWPTTATLALLGRRDGGEPHAAIELPSRAGMPVEVVIEVHDEGSGAPLRARADL